MSAPVKVPAEVERPDQLLGRLTARQLGILAGTGLGLYLAWAATRTLITLPVFAAFAVPVAGTALALALARRDALSLDAFAAAALRHYTTTRTALPRLRDAGTGPTRVPGWITRHATTRRAAAGRTPTGCAHPPVRRVSGTGTGVGLVDLGPGGQAVVAVASTVNLALRGPAEQETLIATFAHWLHSLTTEVQILIRALPVDLRPQIQRLREAAPGLPHPALTAAAQDHAQFLAGLAEQRELLCRQVLVIFRESTPVAGYPRGHASGRSGGRAHTQLAHRLAEATTLLAPAGIALIPLDAEQATAILAAATHPGRRTPARAPAAPGTVITSTHPTPHHPARPGRPGEHHHRRTGWDEASSDDHDDLHDDHEDYDNSEDYGDDDYGDDEDQWRKDLDPGSDHYDDDLDDDLGEPTGETADPAEDLDEDLDSDPADRCRVVLDRRRGGRARWEWS